VINALVLWACALTIHNERRRAYWRV